VVGCTAQCNNPSHLDDAANAAGVGGRAAVRLLLRCAAILARAARESAATVLSRGAACGGAAAILAGRRLAWVAAGGGMLLRGSAILPCWRRLAGVAARGCAVRRRLTRVPARNSAVGRLAWVASRRAVAAGLACKTKRCCWRRRSVARKVPRSRSNDAPLPRCAPPRQRCAALRHVTGTMAIWWQHVCSTPPLRCATA